jgi:hypothetical protein
MDAAIFKIVPAAGVEVLAGLEHYAREGQEGNAELRVKSAKLPGKKLARGSAEFAKNGALNSQPGWRQDGGFWAGLFFDNLKEVQSCEC